LLRDRDRDRLPPREGAFSAPPEDDEEDDDEEAAFASVVELEGVASAVTALMGFAARDRAASHFSKDAWSGQARRQSCPLVSLPLLLLAAAAIGGVTMSKKVVGGGGLFIHSRRVSRSGCATVQPSKLKLTSLDRVLYVSSPLSLHSQRRNFQTSSALRDVIEG
jgi:hypothetical protein